MPNPVPVPAGPLSINDVDTTLAEAFVAAIIQVMQNGTSGGTSTLDTPATVFQLNIGGVAVPLTVGTKEEQLFFRQLGIALAKSMALGATLVIPPPIGLVPILFSDGTTKGSGIYLDSNGRAADGDCTQDAKSVVMGVALANSTVGASVSIAAGGVAAGVLAGATPGAQYFLGPSNGQPVLYDTLTAGQRIVQLGVATSTADLDVRIVDYGVR